MRQVLNVLEEPTEVLVVGCGRRPARLPAETSSWLERHGIATEILATQHACSTFNFMVQERRAVAAVLLPLGQGGAEEFDADRRYEGGRGGTPNF